MSKFYTRNCPKLNIFPVKKRVTFRNTMQNWGALSNSIGRAFFGSNARKPHALVARGLS